MPPAIDSSESIFRLIAEAAPYAILLADPEGKILWANARLEQVFGYSREELIGQPIELLVPEQSRIRHAEHRRSFNDAPEIRPMGMGRDLHGRRKDGSEIPVEIGLSPVPALGGLILASISDISQRKQAEEALRQSEARLRLALSSAHAGTWDWDIRKDRLLWSNDSYALLGLDPETCEASPKLWLKQVHPEDRTTIKEVVESLIDQYLTQHKQDMFDLEYRVLRPDGRIRWVNDLGQVLYDPDHRPVRMIGIMIDVTERKAAEEQLARQAQELARSNAELQEFAYVASHDLQEPLRAVAGCVEIIRRRYQGQLDARADEAITHAVDGAVRMQNLINDLLTYSRVGSRSQPFEPMDSQAALAAALANLKAALGESGAKVTRAALPRVVGDPVQITQLFQNLIGNALKFRGERTPAIHIGAERRKREWVFSVRDNGIGIEPQYFERIFHIFQRLHARTDYPGTGIGLAICKRIVERHDGRIWVESRFGEGTTFFFTLPAA